MGVRFCLIVVSSRGGGSTQQPQRTEPCQCVSGQPWSCRWALQGQMQPLLCAAGVVVGPALGAAAGPGRWFVRVAFCPVLGEFQTRRQHSATTAHRDLPVCEWPALGMPWGTARSNAASGVCSKGGGACTGGCCGRVVQLLVGGAVLPVCGNFQRGRQHSTTTAHRALPVCEWPALGMP